MNKICPECRTEKPELDFYLRREKSRRQDACASYCKSCANKKTYEKQKALKRKCMEYMGGKCSKCEYTGHPAAFDFHHTNPAVKDVTLSGLRSSTFEKVKIELDKCILLCGNCHRLEHSGQGI